MPKENPKNSQSKSTFPTNTNTSSNQNDQEPPKDEEQSQAPSGNPSQPEDSSNQTSNSSIVQNNGKINSNPYMNEIYPTEESRRALTVFQIYEGTGEWFNNC